MAIEHAKTKSVLEWFEEISKIPRCSKNEEQIAAWLMKWAGDNGFGARQDKAGNVVIDVPATTGYEKGPTVVIQGHLDMVCEKTKESTHDFAKDPIKFVYEGDWLTADQTTLGADNGIAIAMAMAMVKDIDIGHPALELLFTVDEETGLTGASALEPGFIKGKILLNVDSEDEGVFTVGCAGGKDVHIWAPTEQGSVPDGHSTYTVVAGGMTGGHSGIDINTERANAIQVLGRALTELQKQVDLRLVTLGGGTAHNAIPRDAEAVITVAKDGVSAAGKVIEELAAALKAEHANTDPKITLVLEEADGATKAMTADSTKKVVAFVMAVPHGVAAMSTDIKDLVETSNNLATLKTEDDRVVIQTSQRSSNMNRLEWLTNRIEAVGHLAGGGADVGGGYPAWQPNMSSELLATCKKVYTGLFDKEPVVEIIHAGLECGIIGSKNEGMDMISFGPTLKNPHSPDEKILVPTIGQVWDFMVALLKTMR